MKSIFSVSQPRAGHHVMEMMMRAALGAAFRYCEYYTEPNCCQTIPCARLAEFSDTGYRLFMQKSHDHQLADPIPRISDLILVQIREPTLRALSNYELDLQSRRREHTSEYLQTWLASEAVYAIGFWRKWLEPSLERRLVLRYEDFLASPLESFRAVFSAIGIAPEDGELECAGTLINVSSKDRSTPFKARTLEASPYFAGGYFAEFMNLVAQEVGYMGYPTWQDGAEPSGPVTTLYRARRAMNARNFEEALGHLERHIARNDVDREVMVMLAQTMLDTGRKEGGRRVLEKLLRNEPEYFEPYAVLAAHAYGVGEIEQAREFVRRAIAVTPNIGRARDFLRQNDFDPELLGELPEVARPSVTREAVKDGFRWILGRCAESEAVIENHMRCPDNDNLRLTLLLSGEFGDFFTRLEAGQLPSPADGGPVTPQDAISALRWLVGRPPHSDAEIGLLLTCASSAALRLRLAGSDEFKQLYRRAVERR